MKHLGNISAEADVVTKKYVDDRVITGMTFDANGLTLEMALGNFVKSPLPTFNQNTTGSAAKWTTARSFKISDGINEGTSVSVDGSNTSGYTLRLPTSLSLSGTLGVSGATTLAALTASGIVNITNETDYSYSGTTISAALKVSGGVYIAKKLRVDGNTYIGNNTHIYAKDTDGNNFSILSLSNNNNVLVGYGGSTRANYNTYIDGNTIYVRNRFTADGSTSTTTTNAIIVTRNTVNETTAVRVGIRTNSPEYVLDINGTTRSKGALTIDAATMGQQYHLIFNRAGVNYIGLSGSGSTLGVVCDNNQPNTANSVISIMGRGVYIKTTNVPDNGCVLTVGNASSSGTPLTVTEGGVLSVANTTDYSSSSAAAVLIAGGVHVGKKLHVGTDLLVDGSTTLGTLSVTSNMEIGGTLDVSGNVGIGNAPVTGQKLTVSGVTVIDNTTDYSVSGTTVSAALKVSGGAHIAKKLHVGTNLLVDGDSTMSGVLNITGVTGYAQGIRIHPSSGTSSIWFGAVNNTGFDAGMWGITVDTVTGGTPSTKIRIRGTETADSTTPDDYLTIINGGYVGINATPTTDYRLYVGGASRLNGTVYLGGTTYCLGNGAAESKLYSLTIGSSSSTQMSVTNGGIVTLKASTALGNISSYANSTATLKVGGGVSINGNLAVYGKKIYLGGTYYLELDTNGYLHTNAPFYSDSWVASGGIGNAGGGGGSSLNVVSYSAIQTGTATGVGTENFSYVPSAYALRKTYQLASSASTTVTNLRGGNSNFNALLMRNTNNSPTMTFEGEYDNNLGANITLGTLSGYRATISSTTYTGLSVGSDFFIPNGKHLYTYDYNGNPRSAVFYPSANYDYLQLGDSGCATNIKGSTVEIGAALSVTGNIVPTSNATYNLGSSSKRFERAYIRYIDTPSNVLLRFCTAGTEAMNISTGGNVNIGSTSSATYKLQVNGTFYASGAATLGSSLSTSGDISTSGDVVITKTANNPAVTFKGEYDNNLGANITIGSITGNKETISSVTYTGVKVSSDLFIPNGKHLYTYNYNGAPRSIAYYATANYNYLQLGDSAGVTNIKGSSVQINDSTLGAAAFKGAATSISSSSTDANLATAKAVYTYVENNCVTSSALNDYALTSSLGDAAFVGVASSLSSSSTDLITSQAVYNGCKHRFFKEYAQSDFANSGTTADTWWRVGSIGTPYSSMDFVFTNNYNSNECASVYFNISQGYKEGGNKIGQGCYVITQTGGYNKFIKGIRIVYYNANRGSSYPTAYIELLLEAGATNRMWCECSTTHQTFSWRTTPVQGYIGSSSASSSYRATTLYTSRGPSTSGGYDCTWLFNLAANASIGQTSASQFLIPQLLNEISTGTPNLFVTESVTINSVAYTMRYDVHVGKRGTAGLMLYYYNSPNSGTVEMTCIEIGYSSGWKVTAKYTKTL